MSSAPRLELKKPTSKQRVPKKLAKRAKMQAARTRTQHQEALAATPEEMEAWREKHDAFVNGKLPLSQARAFMKRARETMLQRQLKNSAVGYLDAKRVYNAGSPDEKKSLDHIMREKRMRLLSQGRERKSTRLSRLNGYEEESLPTQRVNL